MPTTDQLEIIYPNGEIKFYDLNAGRGITNIGRHPENDLVIDSPAVALFHAVLDHRRKPYHLMVLDPQAQTTVKGEVLPPNVAAELRNWDSIEVNGHSIILLERQAGPAVSPPARPAAVPVSAAPSAPMPPSVAPVPVAAGVPPPAAAPAPARGKAQVALAQPPSATPGAPVPRMAALPPDQTDEVVVVDLSAREWAIDVEQTATCRVTIANGGDIVATFDVSVEGLDDTWYAVSPPQINLNEGEHGAVTIAFSAPRLPSSLAGPHHLAIVVTSPNHPGRVARRGATLTINPYYEISIGELSPKQQTVPYRRRCGEAVIPLTNKGNSATPFRLDAQDNERACNFEFYVPGYDTALAQQAELQVQPEQTLSVPIQITPSKRRLIGLSKHTYSYTVTTMPLAGVQTPRSVLGQLQSAPLIGPWTIALLALLMVVVIILIFRPWISSFVGDPPAVVAGEEVTLSWIASRFASLRIEPEVGAVNGADGSKAIVPKQTGDYTLIAENLLTRLNSAWFGEKKTFHVDVEPVLPIIRVFSSDKQDLLTGETATISWEVLKADTLSLVTNGVEATLLSTEHTGKRTITPAQGTTTLELVARNMYGVTKKPLQINVIAPTPTPLPPPVIERFDVQPLVITMGQSIKIDWTVTGVKSVQIAPIPDAFPPNGTINYVPDKTTAFVLTASNGQTETKQIRQVIVNPAPTATPQPKAPTIEYFTASPAEVVRGSADANNVELAWSVIGDYTNIELSGPDFGKVANLDRQGSLSVAVSKNTVFVLTAYNVDQVSSLMATVKVLEPTPTAPPPPTPTPTATPIPVPIIDYFRVSDVQTGTVNVTQLANGDYEVVAGTTVKFTWSARNASKVTLYAGTASLGDQPTTGESTPMLITQPGNFKLVPSDLVGNVVDTASKYVKIVIKELPPPPPPTNVRGPLKPQTPITIEWDYDTRYLSRILGFLLYRANAPYTSFTLLQGESIDKPIDKNQWYWVDSDAQCGRAYYVTAVYETYTNVGLVRLETSPSSTRYYTWPCPTPTPKP